MAGILIISYRRWIFCHSVQNVLFMKVYNEFVIFQWT